jgi:hypothetical protein
MKLSFRVSIAAAIVGAVALTGLYFVHENLPRVIRAPTSLLLAPVAVVDGLCYALGVPGIYGKLIPVFGVNLAATVPVSLALRWLSRRRNRRETPGSTDGA